jgi:hypothetical protein
VRTLLPKRLYESSLAVGTTSTIHKRQVISAFGACVQPQDQPSATSRKGKPYLRHTPKMPRRTPRTTRCTPSSRTAHCCGIQILHTAHCCGIQISEKFVLVKGFSNPLPSQGCTNPLTKEVVRVFFGCGNHIHNPQAAGDFRIRFKCPTARPTIRNLKEGKALPTPKTPRRTPRPTRCTPSSRTAHRTRTHTARAGGSAGL